MAQDTLNQILNQLEALELEELQQLYQTIQKCIIAHVSVNKQATFHQALIDSGLVKQIKQPSYDPIPRRRLIQVQGKPVSETIIEERR